MNVYRYSYSIVIFFNPGTSELFKKSSLTNVFIGLRTLKPSARGRLTEFRFGMALASQPHAQVSHKSRPPLHIS